MDAPITDIVFVCSRDKVPKGYTAITECPCGHDAQLWEKVIGGEPGTRYLCYSKKDQEDDKVVEDMYIPGPNQQYLKKEYKIITDTVEGEEPMYHKQLAVKRVQRDQATKVLVDVIVTRSKDSISKLYTKLAKVNGFRIAFRTGNLPEKESKLGQLSLGGSDAKVRLDDYTPSPTISPRPQGKAQPTVSPADLTSYSPSPSLQNKPQKEDNVVRMKYIEPTFSPPPPTAPPPQATAQDPSSDSAPSYQFPVSFSDDSSAPVANGDVAKQMPSLYPSPPKETTYQPPATTTHPPPSQSTDGTPASYPQGGYPPGPPSYPPPAGGGVGYPAGGGNIGGPSTSYPHPSGGYAGARGAPSTYPPPTGGPPTYGSPGQGAPYQMTPSAQSGYYGSNMTSAAYGNAGFQSGLAGYSAAPPYASAPNTSFDTNIGFSFGGGGSGPPQTALPAPYNPYHQNPSSSASPNYSTSPNYPVPQGSLPPSQPPSQQQKNTYGFNI